VNFIGLGGAPVQFGQSAPVGAVYEKSVEIHSCH